MLCQLSLGDWRAATAGRLYIPRHHRHRFLGGRTEVVSSSPSVRTGEVEIGRWRGCRGGGSGQLGAIASYRLNEGEAGG